MGAVFARGRGAQERAAVALGDKKTRDWRLGISRGGWGGWEAASPGVSERSKGKSKTSTTNSNASWAWIKSSRKAGHFRCNHETNNNHSTESGPSPLG